jgi:hypothetical protein
MPVEALRNAAGCKSASNLYEGKREMEFLSEFWLYMRSRKKFFLLPIVVMLGLFAGLVILTKGTAIAPFIYTLF